MFLVLFWGSLPGVFSSSLFFGWSSLPLVFWASSASSSTPLTRSFSSSFLPRLLMIFQLLRLCLFVHFEVLIASFGHLFPPSLSLCLSSVSCPFSSRTSFSFFSLSGVCFPTSRIFCLVPVVATRSVFQFLVFVFIIFYCC